MKTPEEYAKQIVKLEPGIAPHSFYLTYHGERLTDWSGEALSMEKLAEEYRRPIIEVVKQAQEDAINEVKNHGIPGLPMTDDELQEIMDRYDATTAGEWTADTDWGDQGPMIRTSQMLEHSDPCIVFTVNGNGVSYTSDVNNAQFMAHAHQDIPKMYSYIQHLLGFLRDVAQDTVGERIKDAYQQGFMAGKEAGKKELEEMSLDTMLQPEKNSFLELLLKSSLPPKKKNEP